MCANLPLADRLWVALANLHRSMPNRASFRADEIVAQLGVRAPEFKRDAEWYTSLHMVANIAPTPFKLRMFYMLPDRTYRLFRPGDLFHVQRTGRSHPRVWDLPSNFRDLLTWYSEKYAAITQQRLAA
jgi:hypothetical protein